VHPTWMAHGPCTVKLFPIPAYI